MKLQLHEVSLRLPEFSLEIDAELTSNRTAIFGPSGAGKTTLLEIIAGFRPPQAGQVEANGIVFSDARLSFALPIRARKVGYVSQDDLLFPHLNVRRNLLYGYSADSSSAIDHVISFLEIEPLLSRNVRELSHGEKQRVTIGRALLSQPRLLLLDEPLTGLDSKLKQAIIGQLSKLPDEFGVPMIYVTHDAAEVTALCDEVLLLERGTLKARGKPLELF
jgi:molybdate transport system ATP-binding protein